MNIRLIDWSQSYKGLRELLQRGETIIGESGSIVLKNVPNPSTANKNWSCI